MVRSNPTCDCGDDAECNEIAIQGDPCCRCIPIALCAILKDDYGNISAAVLLEEFAKTYSGVLSCENESVVLRIVLEPDEYGTCAWHVQIFVDEYTYIVDEYVPITGDGCTHPQFTYGSPFSQCSGTLTIERRESLVLPLVMEQDFSLRPYCGSCKCVCKTICVIRKIEGVELPVEEYEWDPYTYQWGGGDTAISLLRDDYAGECVISVPGFENVYLNDCNDGLGFSVDDGYGNGLRATCKTCRCENEIWIPCCSRWIRTTLYVSVRVWPPPNPGNLPYGDEGVDCSCMESLVFTIKLTAANPAVGYIWEGEGELPCPGRSGPCKITVYLHCLSSSLWEVLNGAGVTVVSCDPLMLLIGYDPQNHFVYLMHADCCGQASTLSQGYYLIVTE